MNKKGQKVMFGLMISFMLFIAGTQLLAPITDTITDVRNSTNLNCSSTGLSTGQAGTCVVLDWAPFYWFGTLLVVVVAFLTLKKKLNE